MQLNVPTNFSSLMGDQPITVEDLLKKLDELGNRLFEEALGYAGGFLRAIEVTRLQLVITTNVFGENSPKAKALLGRLGCYFFIASEQQDAQKWAEVVRCYELSGPEWNEHRESKRQVAEARRHLQGGAHQG